MSARWPRILVRYRFGLEAVSLLHGLVPNTAVIALLVDRNSADAALHVSRATNEDAMLILLQDLQTAAANGDYSAVQTIRETRPVYALGKFDQSRNEAIDRFFKLSGRWWRGVDGTRIEVVQQAIDQALYLFERT